MNRDGMVRDRNEQVIKQKGLRSEAPKTRSGQAHLDQVSVVSCKQRTRGKDGPVFGCLDQERIEKLGRRSRSLPANRRHQTAAQEDVPSPHTRRLKPISPCSAVLGGGSPS